MKDTTNRRARSGECTSHSSCCPITGQSQGGRPERLADLLAQFVAGLDRDAAETYVRDRIDYRVDRLVGKLHLGDSERDDLAQDMLMVLVQAIPRYDAGRSQWRTFVCRVLNRRYRHILRKLLAPENGAPSMTAFSDFGDDYEESLVDPATTGGDPHAADDLRMDMGAAISAMPERLQVIARLLMVHSPSAVARILGTSPAAITRAMARIRAHFEEAGLAES
jgi:RNA polymerase sigma factor (sigma-70 family)